MVCISTTELARINARITTYETLLTAADAAVLAAQTDVESYRFDSGEATQQTKRRKLKDLLNNVESIEAILRRLNQRLNGTGVINLNLRRKQRGGIRRSSG